MSRIEDILAKAARDGQVRRTSGLQPDAGPPPSAEPVRARFSGVEPARPQAPAPLTPVPPRTTAPPSAAPAPGPPSIANPVPAPSQVVRTIKPHPLLVAAASPHSTAAEQYRAIRTRIAQSPAGRVCRTIMVTSALDGDGKSLTALNLALTMAQEFHRQVVAIDADLRHASLHKLLGLGDRPGLSDVLLGSVALEDALVALPDLRLTLLPAGSPASQPTELLGSAEMRRVVDTLNTQFDRLVIDTPPASPLADVGVLAPLVDGVVLVVRAGRTPRPAIDRALEEFEPDRLLGLVLNDVEEPAREVRQ